MNFKELLAKNNLRQRDLLKYPSFNRSMIGNWCSQCTAFCGGERVCAEYFADFI